MILWGEFAAVADAPEYHRLNPFRYNSFFYLHVRKVKFRETLINPQLNPLINPQLELGGSSAQDGAEPL